MINCDLDGVLCDLCHALAGKYKVPYPKGQLMPQDFPSEEIGGSFSKIFHDLEKESQEFWAGLKAFDHAEEITNLLKRWPENYRYITSIVYNPACPAGKAEWLKRRYGKSEIGKLVICCGDKSFACNPGDILIDDRRDHCSDWQLAGGYAFHWKEYSRDCEKWYLDQLESLREFVESVMEGAAKEAAVYA